MPKIKPIKTPKIHGGKIKPIPAPKIHNVSVNSKCLRIDEK